MINDVKKESFYSPEELAQQFKMSLSSIYKMIRSGGLPHIRLGKVYRIPASDLKRYLAGKAKGVALQEQPKIPAAANRFVALAKKSESPENILEVWLFGSYARGDYDADSDVDLLVVLEPKTLEASRLITNLAEQAMESVQYEETLNVTEFSKKEWETMKKNKYLLAQTIESEGMLLWKNH